MMDVEEQVELIQLFDLTPDGFPWRAPVVHEIEDRRMKMSDLLIFDILLSSGGIRQPTSLYPPADPEVLQLLLDAIENTTYDSLKQDCLIYFLLKWHKDEREEGFVEQRCIPPQFVALADAYWHLDSGIDIPRAVSLLSDARLNKEYTSKILQALLLTDDPSPLIRKYVRTAKPLLTEPNDIDAYTIALADSSFIEAWHYQRTFAESSETRPRLIHKILEWCLMSKPRLTPLKHLLAFPLTPYEEAQIQAYATDPPSELPSSAIPAIQDLVCLRLVQAGHYATAIKLERQISAHSQYAGESAAKAAQDRRQMMDDIMAAMPLAERQLLEVELEHLLKGKGVSGPLLAASFSSKIGNNADLSMSWEHIRPLTNGATSSSVAKTPRVSAAFAESSLSTAIPQRSGAPRFGGPLPTVSAITSHTDNIAPLSFPSNANATRTQPISATPATSAASALFPQASSAPRSPASASLAGPSVLQFLPVSIPQTGNRSTARPVSLFDTVGSANKVPNAFYQPPVSAGVKRPLGQDVPRPSTLSSVSQPSPPRAVSPAASAAASEDAASEDVDVSMSAPDDEPAEGLPEPDRSQDNPFLDNGISAEFSVSVFKPSSKHTPAPAPIAAPRLTRTRSESQILPGAFIASEDEGESAPAPPRPRASKQTRREQQAMAPPPVPAPTPARSSSAGRTPRPRRKMSEKDLGRTIPGSLMDDEEDEDEDEDEVPPLPPPTPARRSSRRARASKGTNQDKMTEVELTTTQPRRSSRLSIASSSPEPSPRKPAARPKTRKSTAGAAASSKSTGRKKR